MPLDRLERAYATMLPIVAKNPDGKPAFRGISGFRWDIDIRESTILGLVGAGGIGLKLNASINTLSWDEVAVILLLILGTVVVGEWVSARMRHAII